MVRYHVLSERPSQDGNGNPDEVECCINRSEDTGTYEHDEHDQHDDEPHPHDEELDSTINDTTSTSASSHGHQEESESTQESQSVSELELESESKPFFQSFLSSKGPPQIVFLSMLYAIAAGCIIGIVPSIMTDQYAKLHYNLDIHTSCADYDTGTDTANVSAKPRACLDGSSDAQAAAATSSFVSNLMTFWTSSMVGSMSDEYGRRKLMNLSQFLGILSPLCLVILQIVNFKTHNTSHGQFNFTVNPNWYYILDATSGIISWISIALSALSDVMPKKWRASAFGMLLSGFSLGLALSPFLALKFTHLGVSILSLVLYFLAFVYSVLCLPETLRKETAEIARVHRREQQQQDQHQHQQEQQQQRMEQSQSQNDTGTVFHTKIKPFLHAMARPIRELSILNRNTLFRLLSALAFFSGMSTSADQTLLVYYVEDRLSFNDHDIAILFGMVGIISMLVQGLLLKPLTDVWGERYVVTFSFVCGIVTNTMYAFASSKCMIYIAVVIAQLVSMSFPTISAMKSNNVEEFEQGRVQGALYALSSLSNAIGPGLLRLAYGVTKNTRFPGSFFMVGTMFYGMATVCGWALPKDKVNSNQSSGRGGFRFRGEEGREGVGQREGSLEEPLLGHASELDA